jgi:hypothetical protein
MTEMNAYTPGTFCWVELGTTDAKAAKKFYTGLFDWEIVDIPVGPDMIYTMLQVEGKDVAALYEQGEPERSQGVPPHWSSYVSVASADESAAKAQSLGGMVLVEPFDVMDSGRMAIVQDPTGAAVELWQPRQHIGARLVNQPNTVCWNELATNDHQKAGEFYTKLFGWQSQVQDMDGTPYTLFIDGDQKAGMMQMTEEWGNMPPHWLVYFAVADCDRSAEKAKELGGQVVVPPTDIPQMGRFAIVQDPQGVGFGIIKMSNAN